MPTNAAPTEAEMQMHRDAIARAEKDFYDGYENEFSSREYLAYAGKQVAAAYEAYDAAQAKADVKKALGGMFA